MLENVELNNIRCLPQGDSIYLNKRKISNQLHINKKPNAISAYSYERERETERFILVGGQWQEGVPGMGCARMCLLQRMSGSQLVLEHQKYRKMG